MPVHGPSKVDSKCLSMCARVEPFTSLGTRGKGTKLPPHFWQELAGDYEAVSNFIVCLMARLISLDSSHGLDPLVSVYRDLVELSVDQSKYRAWASKPLPATTRPTALELQQAIVSTIYFLTEFYSYRPTNHLRHIYLRWNLARNYSGGDGSGKLADSFEEKVISPFSVPQPKETVVHSPRSQLALGERTDPKLVGRLVDHCCQNHRRANFGVLPPELSKLCLYSTVSEALSYVGLQDSMAASSLNAAPAVRHILSTLGQVALHGQSTEQGDREDLLPLLQLLKDFVTTMFPVDRAEVYQAVMPFYMWPVAHSEYTRRILGLLVQEGKVRGTSFRRKLLVENNLGLRFKKTEIRGQFVHMLVDVSDPRRRGGQFSDIFLNRHDTHSPESLHRMIIRNCFKSVFPSHEMVELETRLQRLSVKSLASVCCECVEVMEAAVDREEQESGDTVQEGLVGEINKIHQKIIRETDTDEEQRDSAVSCGSTGVDSHQSSEEALGIFTLPSPDIPTHTLKYCKYPIIQTKLREVLVQCQKQLSPALNHRTFSRTSMDSTGSSHMDSDATHRVGGTAGDGGLEGDLENSDPHGENSPVGVRVHTGGGPVDSDPQGDENLESSQQSNGIEEGEESCDSHVASPDSGHVMSPDPVSQFSPPPVLDNSNDTKKHRSHSTELRPSDFHVQELNGDSGGSPPNPSDDVFDASSSQESGELVHTFTSQHSTPPGSVARVRAGTARLIRRNTVPEKLNRSISTVGQKSASFTRTSIISHAPSYGTSRKGYTNVAGTPQIPMSVIPNGTRILSTRRSSMALPQKKIALAGAGSPLHASMPKLRVLKIVLAGTDLLVSHTAKAYAHLLSEEPNLFVGLDIRFYHVPLSTASGADWQTPERMPSSNGDVPEAILVERPSTCGLDVNIGRYMSHLDSWYERNVTLAVHHSLRLLPPCQHVGQNVMSTPPPPPLESQQNRSPLTPSKIVIGSVAHYLREANHCIKAKMYKLKMILKPENAKSHKMEHREMYMLHRMDVQRLPGKKSHRQAKPFEANLQLTELSLDGSFVRTDVMPIKEVWSVRASNIPSVSDPTVANPESECFELSVVTAHSEGGMFTKSRLTQQAHYHTYDVTLETKKEPLTVMVDGDTDSLVDNVIRLEITPAHANTGLSTLSRATGSSAFPLSGVKGDSRTERQLFLPLMTFWPVDL